MKTCRRKWLARWLAACIAVVLGMGMCAGLPVSAAYENTYTNTGNQRADIVAVAKTQIGYHEGSLEGTTNSSNNYTKYNVWNGKIEGGYRYAWCHAFVSWCANQAGIGTDIVPKTAGTSTGRSFFVNQGTYRQSAANGGSYVPQAGDIIYYGSGSSPSHVGIVSDCDGSTVYTIEGNYSNKVGTRAINLSNSYIIGYGVPNYKGVNPNPPTWATLSVENNQTVFYSGDTVNFSMASDYATNYTMGVDVNGVRALTQECNGNTSSNIMNDVGEYAVYVTAWNSAGYVDSNVVYFKVIERPWYSSLTPVDLGEQFDSVILAKEPWITFCAFGEDKDYNVELKKEEGITAEMWRFNRQSDGSYVITNFATGRVLDAYGLGTTDFTNVFTDEYNGGDNQKWFIYGKDGGGFVIRAAYTSMVLDIDHAIFESGTNIEMHTKNDSSAQTIALYYENATYGSPKIGDIVSTSTNNSITLNLSDSYYVDKRKVYRSTDKKYWELVNESTDGKGTEITDNNLKSATTYYYKIECSNRYYTETSSIIAVKTNAISLGDLNSDNTLTTADAVLLQRYLLQERTLTQSQWQTADLNADGTVNGFDLALLRQKLVG